MSGKNFIPKHLRSKAQYVPNRDWTKPVFRKQNVLAFLSRIFFLWFVYGCASLPGCKQHTNVLAWIFSAQYGPEKKLQKVWRNLTSFGRDNLGLHKISEKFSRNGFFLKLCVRISTEFGTKRDRFQVKRMSIHPGKKIKQFHTGTNLPFSPGSDEWKIYCEFCGTSLRLKSHPKLNKHNDECLVKISDQNT